MLKNMLVSQRRDIQKQKFQFAYHGTFNVEVWKESRDLGLQSAELCTGAHGYQYAFIKTAKKKRASHIQKIFEAYDREATPGMQIKLTNLPDEPSIVSFGLGHEFMDHAIYKEIKRALEKKCQSYVSWGHCGDQYAGASSSSATTKIRRLLETDMLPASFNPICPKQQRAMHTKNPNNGRLEGKNHFLFRLINQQLTDIFQGLHLHVRKIMDQPSQAFRNSRMVHLIKDKGI
jgi:hypothetical protein